MGAVGEERKASKARGDACRGAKGQTVCNAWGEDEKVGGQRINAGGAVTTVFDDAAGNDT